VLFGDAERAFRRRVDIDIGLGAGSIVIGSPLAVANVTGDAKPDIVFVTRQAGANNDTITVLQNMGAGVFVRADIAVTTLASTIRQLVIADATGDGQLDVLAVFNGVNEVGLLVGPSLTRNNVQVSGVRAIAVADVTADTIPDLVVSLSTQVKVLIGDGDGGFTTGPAVSVNDSGPIHVLDLDGDGVLDALVTDDSDARTTVLQGTGSGTFTSIDTVGSVSSGAVVEVVDVTNDGQPDLVVASDDGDIQVAVGDAASGSFSSSTTFATQPTGRVSLGVRDIDGDGLPELVTTGAANTGSSVSLLRNLGAGDFAQPVVHAVGTDPLSVVIDDFDGDGDRDVAVVTLNGDTIDILRNIGGGTLEVRSTAADFNAGGQPLAVAAVDLDGNGRADVVIGNGNANAASVLLSNTDGTLQTAVPNALPGQARGVAIADVHNDGAVDIVVSTTANSVSVLRGNGQGLFATSEEFPTGVAPVAVAVGKIDGDDFVDLVVAFNSGVSVLVNDATGAGAGKFPIRVDLSTGSAVNGVALADLDKDGKLDIVAANASPATLSVMRGNGNGTFQPKVDVVLPAPASAIAIADLDGDGNVDLALAVPGQFGASVLRGKGDGGFFETEPVGVVTGRAPAGIAIADVNRDGKLDLVVANANSHSASVALGKGDGTFEPALSFATGREPRSIAVADVNFDGRADLVTANASAASASVLLGSCLP
jgi:hypothetical protein